MPCILPCICCACAVHIAVHTAVHIAVHIAVHVPCILPCVYRAYCHTHMHMPYLRLPRLVCSAAGSYHRDVGASPTAKFEARGCRVEALGGGRISLDTQRRSVHVFGYSVGLGGDEGGPPGRGMPDHSQAATTY